MILIDIYLKYKNISLLKPDQIFIWLMSSEDPYVVQSISKLLLILFSQRIEILCMPSLS